MTSSTNRHQQQCSEYAFDASDDQLSAEFRHRLGLLPEEEQDLSDAFKQRLGLSSSSGSGEEPNEVSEITVVPSYDVERDATINRVKFDKFIKSSYQTKTEQVFTKTPLSQPLLAKTNEIDRLASLIVSIAIKRLCGDIPTPSNPSKEAAVAADIPVMTVVFSMFDALSKRGATEPASNKDAAPMASSKRHSLKKLFGGGGNSKHNQNSGDGCDGLDPTIIANIPTLELDLIQFIVGHGILRSELSDEIYCQLCAQVTNNPSPDSCTKGWMLHALCAGCFLPSHQLLKYYFGFLNEVPAELNEVSTHVKRCIHRTGERGPRFHPPNWIEYQAAKTRKSVMLPVVLADGRCETVEADAATTASEMCRKIATSIGLRDRFGFAIYISVYDKVSSLGQGSDHVMDAISECEQLVRGGTVGGARSRSDVTGSSSSSAQWQLFYRKEIFTPWHDVEYDDIATELIYRQIIQGVLSNEYRLRSEDELMRFVARRWYVEHGDKMVPGLIQSTLHELLPTSLLASGKSRDGGWTQAIVAAFEQMGFANKKYSRQEVKWSIVESGKRKWPLHFSGLFEAYCVHGPQLPKNDVVIAVSCRGVFLLEEPYKVLFGLHFYELVDVKFIRTVNGRGPGLTLITVSGDQWTFLSPNADTITRLLTAFLDGLRRRSRWSVAIEDFLLQDHTNQSSNGRHSKVFDLRHGDIVELLDETTQESLKDDWMYGRSERTGACGSFPFDCIYIIPTCEKPPSDLLEIFTDMSSAYVNRLPRKRGAVVLASQTIGRHAGHGVQSAI